MSDNSERIGIILVHGIGEQGRFEHLETHARPLIEALRRRAGATVSVEILKAPSDTYRSNSSSWSSGPSVRIAVKTNTDYKEILLHEVWWADINEPYSVFKQLRFWLWGLSIWAIPRKPNSSSPGYAAMTQPVIPGYVSIRASLVQLELFAVSSLFLMAAFSFGFIFVLLKRLLNISAPDFVQTMVNYVSGVKLYNQSARYGAELFGKDELLDAMGEPPRVSIRRRMVEVMVEVATQNYDRWYIFAHSLGSVVAFNGIMEPAETLAHYIDKSLWEKLGSLATPLAGDFPADPPYFQSVSTSADTTPRRRVWVAPGKTVYRHLVLSKFRGFLTYGSPLEKFAALWQARVSVNCTEPHFIPSVEWVNIYDPIDPVSGVLRAFGPAAVKRGAHTPSAYQVAWPPQPLNIGFKASNTLLYAHLRYLSSQGEKARDLSDAVGDWVLGGGSFRVPTDRPRWFEPYSGAHNFRSFAAGLQWGLAAYVLAFLGSSVICFIAPNLLDGISSTISGFVTDLERAIGAETAFGPHPFLSIVIFASAFLGFILTIYLLAAKERKHVLSIVYNWMGIIVCVNIINFLYPSILGITSSSLPGFLGFLTCGCKNAGLFIVVSIALTLLVGGISWPFMLTHAARRPTNDGAEFTPDSNPFGLRE